MKKILLCTDGSIFAQSSYQYAAWLLPRLQADLEVLYVSDIRAQKAIAASDFSGSIGIDASQELLNRLVEIEHEKAKINHQKAKIIIETAKNFFTQENIDRVKFTHHTGFLVDSFHDFEENADLIILGKRGENAEFASKHLGANLERILRSSHKPCLVTSRHFQPIDKIVFAYDGGKSCQKALEFLVNFPVFKGLELHIIAISKNPEEAKSLETAQSQLISAGFQPVTQILQGHPEAQINQYVESSQANLLIMGAYGHNRIRHLVIGSTTAQILRSSHIPVLLFR